MSARVASSPALRAASGWESPVRFSRRGYRVANSRTISDSKDLRPAASLVLVAVGAPLVADTIFEIAP